MRNRIVIGLGIAAASSLTACSESPEEALANRWPMLEQYCTECHNDAEAAGDMSLEGITPARGRGEPREVGNGRPAPARERHAAARRRAPGRRAGRRVRSRGRSEPRRGGSGSRRDAGPRRVAPVESRRIRHRGARSARTSTSTPLGCCRRTRRATASTTSPRSCASLRRISISTSRRRATSVFVPSAARTRSLLGQSTFPTCAITRFTSTVCRLARVTVSP